MSTRHFPNLSATTAAVSWSSSERHHTTHRNHARKVARAWRREYRIYDLAFLPGRWEPGYYSEQAEARRRAA